MIGPDCTVRLRHWSVAEVSSHGRLLSVDSLHTVQTNAAAVRPGPGDHAAARRTPAAAARRTPAAAARRTPAAAAASAGLHAADQWRAHAAISHAAARRTHVHPAAAAVHAGTHAQHWRELCAHEAAPVHAAPWGLCAHPAQRKAGAGAGAGSRFCQGVPLISQYITVLGVLGRSLHFFFTSMTFFLTLKVPWMS